MKNFLLFVVAIVLSLSVSLASAADGTGGIASPVVDAASTSGASVVNSSFLLKEIQVTSANQVLLTFNSSLQLDTLRVRITDQATNETIKVASITGTVDTSAAVVELATNLIPGASYILTITSALSKNNDTIRAGVDSIREFTAPLKSVDPVLSAPANPAVAVATGTAVSPATTPVVTTLPAATTGSVKPPVTTLSGSATQSGALAQAETLPATGMPTTLLILFAGCVAGALLVMRKKA